MGGLSNTYELVKHVLFTRTDADEPGMRVVLHEEQRERFNAGSLLEKGQKLVSRNLYNIWIVFFHTF